jgi:hypothetical protein
MSERDAEVKKKKAGRAEKAAMRKAIRRERRGKRSKEIADEARSFGTGLSRVIGGYDFVVVVMVALF